ncbi:Protein of unknown function, partial [Marinactinospora thermotolerans DSM 45154]
MGGSIEPGWYADPHGAENQLRWWNGEEWTQHVRSLSELSERADGAESTADLTDLSQGDRRGRPDDADQPTADLTDHTHPTG